MKSQFNKERDIEQAKEFGIKLEEDPNNPGEYVASYDDSGKSSFIGWLMSD
ncbi:hypothetical protein ACH6EH_07085 [Paenibacillus sp. JSM ZJ436]|uniref:hypothetical protein n=1 Tax=Paenibacillus sp. JSM ZJ436 TaxID=3376190 RepID=UPI003789A99F